MCVYEAKKMLDGSKVYPDGTIQRLDGTKTKLQEGEIIFQSGVVSAIPKHEIQP